MTNEAEGPWASEETRCFFCWHEWVSVHPCAEELECPNCHRMTKSTTTIERDKWLERIQCMTKQTNAGQCCKKCSHWKQIQPNRESWGTCEVPVEQVQIPDPMRAILRRYVYPLGSVGPSHGVSCNYFRAKS